MRRASIVKALVFVLSAGFVIAVQRDTVLRRWCLPSPTSPSHLHGVLQTTVTDFDLDGLTGRQAIKRLEERYNVRIGIVLATDWPELDGRLSGRVERATVEQLLWRICGTLAEVEGNTEWIESADAITLRYGHAKEDSATVRAYDVGRSDKRLVSIKTAVPDWAIQFLVRNSSAGSDPNDAAVKRIASLTVHGHGFILGEGMNNPLRANPVVRFGSRVVVIGKVRTQWVISELLRE